MAAIVNLSPLIYEEYQALVERRWLCNFNSPQVLLRASARILRDDSEKGRGAGSTRHFCILTTLHKRPVSE